MNLLAGVKYRLPGGTFVGVAYQRPVTDAHKLSSQIVVQSWTSCSGRRPTEVKLETDSEQ